MRELQYFRLEPVRGVRLTKQDRYLGQQRRSFLHGPHGGDDRRRLGLQYGRKRKVSFPMYEGGSETDDSAGPRRKNRKYIISCCKVRQQLLSHYSVSKFAI